MITSRDFWMQLRPLIPMDAPPMAVCEMARATQRTPNQVRMALSYGVRVGLVEESFRKYPSDRYKLQSLYRMKP